MAKPFDATLNTLLDAHADDWAAFLAARAGVPFGPVESLDTDLSATLQADRLFRIGGATPSVLHLELESGGRLGMPEELLRYNVAARGVIPLSVIQKYLNFHYSVSLDLFGGETSTNVANYYTAGLKGRWLEERRKDDHKLTSDAIMVDALVEAGGGEQSISQVEVSALVGLNTDLRRQYIADCEGGVKRWNRILESAGLPQRLALPHIAFNRHVGAFAGMQLVVPFHALAQHRRLVEHLLRPVDRPAARAVRPLLGDRRAAGGE